MYRMTLRSGQRRHVTPSQDGKARRRLALKLAPPHLAVSRFEMAREARRIKQGRPRTGKRELLLELFQGVSVAPKLERQAPVILERVGNQFRQTDRLEEACRDPAGKGLSYARHHRD